VKKTPTIDICIIMLRYIVEVSQMRTITKVSKQKKSGHRYNIYLDGSFAFGVDEDVLIKNNLHKGLTLSEEDIAKLMDEELLQSAYLLAIRYLSYRIRTKREIELYLQKKEIEAFIIEQTVRKLVNEKLINDAQFAQSFVRDRMNQTSKGPQIIKKELIEKGINVKLATEAITEYSYEKQLDKTSKWVNRELKKSSKHSFQRRLNNVRFKLMQKGFGQDVINDTMQNIDTEIVESDERNALHFQAEKLYRRYSKKHTGFELRTKLKTGLYQRGFSSNLINEYMDKLEEKM